MGIVSKTFLQIPLTKILGTHYKLFYPVTVEEERLFNYTFTSVCARNMTHRGPMGDNEKMSLNTPKCLFQGEKYYKRAQSTNKSHDQQVIFMRHPCGFESQIQQLIYKCEIKLLYFYDAMLVNGQVLSTKAKHFVQRKLLWGSGAKTRLNLAPAFNKRTSKHQALESEVTKVLTQPANHGSWQMS